MEILNIFVIESQLVDRPGPSDAERGGNDVHLGQFPGSQVLEMDGQFIGDGCFQCLDKRTANHDNVATCPGPLRARGLSIQEA